MTGTDILNSPVRVDKAGERLYFHAPGEVCVDVCSGAKEDRARVLALLGQAQRMAALLNDAASDWCLYNAKPLDCGSCLPCRARVLLRDARVMSGADGRGEG